MTKEQIFEGLKEILFSIKPKINQDQISLNSLLLEDLSISSLEMLLLTLAIENKFGIQFESSTHLSTVQDVVDYVIAQQ